MSSQTDTESSLWCGYLESHLHSIEVTALGSSSLPGTKRRDSKFLLEQVLCYTNTHTHTHTHTHTPIWGIREKYSSISVNFCKSCSLLKRLFTSKSLRLDQSWRWGNGSVGYILHKSFTDKCTDLSIKPHTHTHAHRPAKIFASRDHGNSVPCQCHPWRCWGELTLLGSETPGSPGAGYCQG